MTVSVSRGQRTPLSSVTTGVDLYVGIVVESEERHGTWDISCFGLDEHDRLADERYFVFFNQSESPEAAIRLLGPQSGDTESFRVTLPELPDHVHKLMFCASLDGSGTAAAIRRGHLRIAAGGSEVLRYDFTGADFTAEKAVMIGCLYRRGEWRVTAEGQGFAGGLADLLVAFGGEVIEDEPEAEPAAAQPGFAPPPGPGGGTAASPPPSSPQPPTPAPAPAPSGEDPFAVLTQYAELPAAGRWIRQNGQLVKVTLGAEVYARRGAMVAYQGEIDFAYKGSGGLRAFAESKLTKQVLPLMTCGGTGEVFLADDARDVHVVDLGSRTLCVTARHVLAFDPTVRVEVKRLESAGLPGGILYYLELGGPGSVVLTTLGRPLALPVDGHTFADVNATVAWTAGMRVSVATGVTITRTVYAGVSGETYNLQFQAMSGDHAVIVQPYEV